MSLNLRNFTIICMFVLFSGNVLAQGNLSIVSITVEDVSCLNGNDGSITITIQGGQPPYTYTWIRLPFAFDQIESNETTVTFPGIFPITAANYLIDISDAIGNNVGGGAFVDQPTTAVAVSVTPDPAQTCSGNDLQLFGNATGGTPPYTHSWTGPGAAFLDNPNIENPVFNSSVGGDFELTYTLTDNNDCFTSQTITINNTSNPQTNAGADDQTCVLQYVLNATQSFGTGTWSASDPGSVTFDNINDPNTLVTVDAPGVYTLTWTEENDGCSDSDNVQITFNENPNFTTNLTNPSTSGSSDGSIEVNVTAGQPNYLYVLTDEFGGETTHGPVASASHTFTGLSEGVYNIRVTDANGCFVSQNRSLASSPVLSVNIETTATCNGLDNGAIDIEILAGSQPYDVQVTSLSDGEVVFSATGTNLMNYTISNLADGNYLVEISDDAGNIFSSSVTIDEGPFATISYPGTPFCDDGTAEVTLNGFPGGTFSSSPAGLVIDPLSGTINLTNSNNGTYTVSYAYSDGTCSGVAHTTVVLGELSSVTISYDESPYCQQAGGIAPVTIVGQVLNSSQNTYVMGRVSSDVKAQPMPGDNSACPGTLVVNIPANAVITAVDVTYRMTSTGVSRIIDQRSQLRSVSPGGTAESVITYGFINSTGSYTYTRTGLGIANGVTGGGDIEFELHAWRAFPTLGGCSNTSTWVDNGTWTITVHYTSGHEFVADSEDLVLDPVTGDIDLENSLPGTYQVFYNYTEGACTGSASTFVTILAAPDAPLAEDSTVCFDGEEHFFNVTAPDGTILVWYDAPVNGNVIDTPSESQVGEYTVWVATQSPEGCLSERVEVSLSIIDAPAIPIPVNVTECFDGNEYSATATVEDGAELIWYASSTGDELSSAPTGTDPNTYTAWAAARIGSCESDRVEVTLTILESPEPPTAINEDFCFDDNIYQATAVPPAGATIAWYANQTGPQTAEAPSGSEVGTYTAWAASVIGECESERVQVTLTIHALPEASFTYIADSFCQTPDIGYLPIITTEDDIIDQVFTVTTDDGTDPDGLIINQTTGEIFPGQSVPGTYTIEYRYGIEIILADGSIFCYNETSIEITIDAGPELVVENVTHVLCAGTETGSITVSVSSGTAPFTYELLDDELDVIETIVANNTNAQTFDNLAAGSWYVRVSDATSCNSISDEIIINEASPITIDPASVNYDDVSCNNGSDGQISFTAAGGTGQLSYFLLQGGTVVHGPQNNGNFTGLTAGTYDLRVVDEAGCILDYPVSITISQPEAILLTVAANPDINCEGDEATIEASAVQGVAPYGFTLWFGGVQIDGPLSANAGQTVQFTGLTQSGEYTVRVQDANGCNEEQSITISAPVVIAIFNITSDPLSGEFCEGGTGVTLGLNSSETGIQYQLLLGSDVVATQAGTGNALSFGTFTENGTYTVLATHTTSGCTQAMNGSINVVTLPSPDVAITTFDPVDYCANEDIFTFLSATAGFSSYQWYLNGEVIVGATAANYTAEDAGTYTVWVEDANGCSAISDAITITIYDVPTATFSYESEEFCESIDPAFGYMPIIVTEDVIVDQIFTVVNSVPESAVLIIDQDTGEIFPGQSDSGTYTISYRFGISISIGPGIDDVIFCYNEYEIEITINPSPGITIVDTEDALCAGEATGSITVVAPGGQAPFTYELLNESLVVVATIVATDNQPVTFNLLAAGTYYVSVDDENTCTSVSGAIVISEPDAIIIDPANVTVEQISCNGAGDGAIEVVAQGGTGQLLYTLLRNGTILIADQANGIFAGLQEGAYTIQVTDANDCFYEYPEIINIAEPEAISLTVAANPDITCEGDEATIEASATQGVAPYSFTLWFAGVQQADPVAGNEGEIIQFTGITQSGEYTVRVSDANGCIEEQNITISTPVIIAVFTITADPGSGEYCPESDGVILGLSGSEAGIQYQLLLDSDVVATQAGTGNALSFGTFTENGTYTVLATHTTSGCTQDMNGSINVVTLPSPFVEITTFDPLDYCANEDIFTFLSATAGFSSYQWYLNGEVIVGATAANYIAEDAGIYTVWVEDANGCTAISDAITITIYDVPTATFSYESEEFCESIDPTFGYLPIIVTEDVIVDQVFTVVNSVPASAVLSMVQTTGEIFPGQSDPGTYTILFRFGSYISTGPGEDDKIICYGEYEIEITINQSPVLTIVETQDVVCAGEASGFITVVATGGQLPYTYELLDQDENVLQTIVAETADPQTFENLGFGIYYISVTDINGCGTTLSAPIIIDEPDPITIDPLSIVITPVSCNGENDGQLQLTANGGSGILSYYLLQDGNTIQGPQTGSANFAGLEPGSYTISIIDEADCSIESEEFQITEPDALLLIAFTDPDIVCEGNEAAIEASATLGAAPYTFTLWFNGEQTGEALVAGEAETVFFAGLSIPGTYTVRVSDANGCQTEEQTEVSEPQQLTIFNIQAQGENTYCFGGEGVGIILDGSETDINYLLFLDGTYTGITITGTGSDISFGQQTEPGIYTAMASDPETTCQTMMNGSVEVIILPLPEVFNVTGGGDYCEGADGIEAGLDGSQINVNYILLLNGEETGITVAGTGDAISFGLLTEPGVYTVSAFNTITGCETMMQGNASVGTQPLPLVYNITGGGNYCEEGDGVEIGLDNSQTGVTYYLVLNDTDIIAVANGTGSAISFGLITPIGTYTAEAESNSTGCTVAMNGEVQIGLFSLPIVYNVIGGGSFCNGQEGVEVGLDGSETGISYLLFLDGEATGDMVNGTGNPVTFGPQTLPGIYTVLAVNQDTACESDMTGHAEIEVLTLPDAPEAVNVEVCFDDDEHSASAIPPAGTSLVWYTSATGDETTTAPTGTQVNTYTAWAAAIDDITGCESERTPVTLTIFELPEVPVPIHVEVCYDEEEHTANATPPPGASIKWYFSETGDEPGSAPTGTDPGVYSAWAASVDDITGCESSRMHVSLIINALPGLPEVFDVEVCFDGEEHSASATPPNGAILIWYENETGEETTTAPTGTNPGTYTAWAATQFAATECESERVLVTLVIFELPEATISYGADVFCPEGTMEVTITTEATIVSGIFTAEPADGLDLDENTGTINLETSATGIYQVQYQFTDENGCDNTAFTTIEISDSPVIVSITSEDAICAGEASGSITVEVSAGALPYAYELLDEELNLLETFIAFTTDPHTFEGLLAGTYFVRVADNNGCGTTLSDAIIIDEPDAITIDPMSIQITNITCNGENDGQLQLTANGGSGALEYTLTSNGEQVGEIQTGSANFTGLEPGIYVVVITDEAGCSIESDEFEITEPEAILLTATTNPDIVCEDNEATIEASALLGTAPFTFTLWFNGEQIGEPLTAGDGETVFFTSLTTPGTYTVRVTDDNGCLSEEQTVVSEPQILAVFNVQSIGDNSYCFGDEGVEIILDGSEAGISYLLILEGEATGITVEGTGDAISFGVQNETGIYTVMAFDPVTGCQVMMDGSVEVTVIPLPEVFTVTGGGVYCEDTEGVEIGLDGSETGVIYTLLLNGEETGITAEGTGEPISFGLVTETGIYTVSASTATGCTSMMEGSAEVTQSPLPQASIEASATEICEGGTVTLTASGGETYLWTADPEYDFEGTENDPEITVILTQTTTFTLTAINSCGSDTDEVTIMVVPTPEIDLGEEIFACEGETVLLDAGEFENATYLWSDGSTEQTLEVTESGLYWVEVTNLDTQCVSYGEVTVTFHALPLALVAEDQTICAGDQVFIGVDEGLEPIPANTYFWTSEPEDPSLIDPTISNPMVSPLVTTTYTLVETYIESGCTNSNSVTITVIDALADAGPDQEICQGESVMIGPDEVDDNLLYSWISSNPAEVFDNNIPNPVVSPLETTTYTLLVQHAELGCISTDETVVTVNPSPNAETGPDLDICSGDVVTIGTEYTEPMPLNTYLWISEPNDESISDPTISNPTVSPLVTTTYTLIETYVLSGCTTENSVVVTVHEYPEANVIDDRDVCVDEVINLGTGSAQDGLTYSWTSVPQGFFSNEANPQVIPSLYQLDSNNQITFILEVSNAFCSTSASVTITVQPLPVVDIADDMVFCSAADAQNIAIGGDAIAGYTYFWTSDQDDGFSSTDANPLVSPAVTTIYTVVVTDSQTGCSAIGHVIITINDLMIVNQGNPEVCENSESAFLGIFLEVRGGIQPYQFFWTDSDGNQISNILNPEVSAPFSGVYNLMVMDALGCMVTTSVEVIIIESPEVSIHIGNMHAGDTYSIYPGQTVIFEAVPSGLTLYEFYVIDPEPTNDNNDNGEKAGIEGARLVQSGAFNTWTTSELETGQQVYVLGYAGECPGMSQIVTIVINELPNAFTPDGDGFNDIFGAGAELTIFNRWGQKVFEGTQGWDGTFNGRKVSPGTYYYLLNVYDQNNNKSTVKGSVTVILN